MTDIQPVTTPPDLSDDDELWHYYCCDDINLGLCSSNLTDTPINDELEANCIVCADLNASDYCPLYKNKCPHVE